MTVTSLVSTATTLVALLAAVPAVAADYVQASGSRLAFATRYDGELFTGTFPGFSTRLSFDPADPAAARLEVDIPLAAADSGNSDRDATLRGADFFNAARFASARYTATGVRALGDNRFVADGTLQLRGVSRPVALTFTWTPGPRPVLKGTATVKRLDFGVGGGDWADTKVLPNDTAISTVVHFTAR